MKKRQSLIPDWQFWLLIIVAIIVAGIGLCCCSPAKKANGALGLQDDNILEESLEWGLDKGLDIKVDLTGSSPE